MPCNPAEAWSSYSSPRDIKSLKKIEMESWFGTRETLEPAGTVPIFMNIVCL